MSDSGRDMRTPIFVKILKSCVDGATKRKILKEATSLTHEQLRRITAELGESLGIDWTRFDIEQFRMGLDVELEHGSDDLLTNVSNDDEIITGKIALAHLNEFPDYYT
jgi:hypothetical protein